jgi:hypothetical protein
MVWRVSSIWCGSRIYQNLSIFQFWSIAKVGLSFNWVLVSTTQWLLGFFLTWILLLSHPTVVDCKLWCFFVGWHLWLQCGLCHVRVVLIKPFVGHLCYNERFERFNPLISDCCIMYLYVFRVATCIVHGPCSSLNLESWYRCSFLTPEILECFSRATDCNL